MEYPFVENRAEYLAVVDGSPRPGLLKALLGILNCEGPATVLAGNRMASVAVLSGRNIEDAIFSRAKGTTASLTTRPTVES